MKTWPAVLAMEAPSTPLAARFTYRSSPPAGLSFETIRPKPPPPSPVACTAAPIEKLVAAPMPGVLATSSTPSNASPEPWHTRPVADDQLGSDDSAAVLLPKISTTPPDPAAL